MCNFQASDNACKPGLPDGLFPYQKPMWVNFDGPWNGKCWYVYDHLAIWYSLWLLGIFFPVLVCLDQENLATLLPNIF
jgi:hypothetical protein